MERFEQLRKSTENWIRFELGLVELEGNNYFKEMHFRAKSIINFLFNANDTIWLIASISNYVRRTELPNLKRFLRNKKLIYNLQCKTLPYEDEEDDLYMETVQYRLKVKKDDIRIDDLIKAIGNVDFSKKPKINGDLYFLNETKGILFHMYDDRGCDVFSLKRDTLRPVYHQYRKWILDYDRLEIDRAFGEGLCNCFETNIESERRLHTNRITVEETKINLYQDNTCHITHSLEIPSENFEECLSEMSQTGFSVEFGASERSDYINIKTTKTEALALIDYQTELMFLYSKKYQGKYNGWSVEKVF